MQVFLEMLKKANEAVQQIVWGTPMLLLIISVGVYMTVKLNFFQITKAGCIFKNTLLIMFKASAKKKNVKGISPLRAASTALAATIGTGNIAGVATAITLGGPGAVFWMWVSAFFGMMTAFAENTLGGYYRRKDVLGNPVGGAMYYLEYGLKKIPRLKKISKPLAIMFSLFCLLASLGMGNMTQSNTIANVLYTASNKISVNPVICGAVLTVFVATVLVGGTKRVGQITEKLVPFMAVVYIIGTLAVIGLNLNSVPVVFSSIVKNALGIDSVIGGFSGAMVSKAISTGIRRGVFSNEAGLGSAVTVNSSSSTIEPIELGMWGIFEVFFDTILVCTLTAFALLSTGVIDLNTGAALNGLEGAALVTSAFSVSLGDFAGIFVSLSTVFFALSTIMGWSFFGIKSAEYLLGKRGINVYKTIFVLATFFGAIMDLDLVWQISDTFNGLMAIPNLIGLILLRKDIIQIYRNYRLRKFKGKGYITPFLSAYPKIQAEQEIELHIHNFGN